MTLQVGKPSIKEKDANFLPTIQRLLTKIEKQIPSPNSNDVCQTVIHKLTVDGYNDYMSMDVSAFNVFHKIQYNRKSFTENLRTKSCH